MNTFEDDAFEAAIGAECAIDYKWVVSELEDEHHRNIDSFPISGDHLTRYKGDPEACRRDLIRAAAVKSTADSFKLVDRT